MLDLIAKIRQCNACGNFLAHGVNPVVQLDPASPILIVGQAPGRKVHESGIPWDDKSGEKLRDWLGVDKEQFYDPKIFSIMPMGFCYPGKGKSGDLPPRPECAKLWHQQVLQHFESEPLIILIGQYAQKHYLKTQFGSGLTDVVRHYERFLPDFFPLPHPSPRNQAWLKVNPWFSEQVLPELKDQVARRLPNYSKV